MVTIEVKDRLNLSDGSSFGPCKVEIMDNGFINIIAPGLSMYGHTGKFAKDVITALKEKGLL